MLAFDPDAGTIAFVDSKGFPGRIDLRETDVGKASKAKLTSISSANGSDISSVAYVERRQLLLRIRLMTRELEG